MAKAGAATGGFAGRLAAIPGPLGAVGAGLATLGASLTTFLLNPVVLAAAAIGALVIAVKTLLGSFGAIDNEAKLAASLGITQASLVGLQHAADLAGSSSEGLAKALQKMTKNTADAAQGTGEAVKAYQKLGLSVKMMNNLKPDQQFKIIADAMNQLEKQTDRVQVAYQLFGKEGVNLVNTLALGSAGLDDATKMAEELGLALNSADFKGVEEANDAMAEMKTAISGMIRQLAVALAPAIKDIAKAFTDILIVVIDIVKELAPFIKLAAKVVAAPFKALSFIGKGIVDLFSGNQVLNGPNAEDAARAAAMQASSREEAAEAALEQFDAITKVVEAATKERDEYGKTKEALQLLELQKLGADEATIQLVESLHKEVAAMKAIEDTQKEAIKAAEELQKAQQRLAEEMTRNGERVFEATRTPLEKYEAELDKLSELLNAGAISWDTYGRAVRKAQEELNGHATNVSNPGVILKGTAAAYEAQAKLNNRGSDPMSKLVDKTDKNLEENRKQTHILQAIQKLGEKDNVDKVANF